MVFLFDITDLDVEKAYDCNFEGTDGGTTVFFVRTMAKGCTLSSCVYHAPERTVLSARIAARDGHPRRNIIYLSRPRN